MNSMHNSFGGSAPGGYGSPYPGYVPPTALPYYNGYPPDLSQGPSTYYGKPAIPGYSTGMSSYPSAAGINNSMYYQQYGLGYQYGYSKYGLSPGLPSGLGYGGDLSNPGNITPSTLGGMQAPSNDLGLTGSMFSKGNSSSVAHTTANSSVPSTAAVTSVSNNSTSKYSSASSNIPHPLSSSQPNMMSSLAPSAPSSPNVHSQSSAIHGGMATSSPPNDSGDTKKDLDKMKRCQICGQVFRLMSECLAHMKTAHETLMPMYNIPGHGNLNSQGMLSHHLSPQTPARPSSNAPDSPLMALERMGWGKEQPMTQGIHSSAPHSAGYPPHVPQMPPHLPDARYGEPSSHSAKRLNDYYNSCSGNSSPMNQEASYSMERQSPSVQQTSTSNNARPRKSSSYSVSSIIGESSDSRSDQTSAQESTSNQSSGPPPCLTPNLPVTSVASLPPNLSPNPPSGLSQSSTGTSLAQQPPQLTPNLPNSVSTSQLVESPPHCSSESEPIQDGSSLEKQPAPTQTQVTDSANDKSIESPTEPSNLTASNEDVNASPNKSNQESEVQHSNVIQPKDDQLTRSQPNEMTEGVSSSGVEDGQVNKTPTDNEEDISSSDAVNKIDAVVTNEDEAVTDVSKSQSDEAASNQEEEIGDEDEPGDPSHPLHDQTPPSQSPSQTQVWTNLPSGTPPEAPSPKTVSLPTPPQSVQEQSPQPQPSPHPPPAPTPLSDTPSPSIPPQNFYAHPKNRMSPMSPHDFNDKQMHQHNSPLKSNPQHSPYQGAWPQGYVPSGASPTGYQYHQYPMHPGQSIASNSSKMHGGYPPRYPNQYPGYDSRRQMHSSYNPGHWYPPGRSDSKPPWVSWGSHQGHPYSHQYYYGSNGGPSHMTQHSPMGHKFPPSHPVQAAPCAPQQVPSPSLASPIKAVPEETPIHTAVEEKVKEVDAKPVRKGDRQKAKRGRAGPKSRVDRKHLPAPKVDSVIPPEVDKGVSKDFDSSIYAFTPVNQNGNLSSVSISPDDANSNLLDSDAVENDENDQPKLTVLKPAKKRKSTDGSFIGPKRIKIAKRVRQRQQCRQKLLQDQIKQTELEEQLTQQWVERAAEEEGPLANVLLKSSLLLGDNNVQEQDIMEDSIASITAELLQSNNTDDLDRSSYNQSNASTSPNSSGGKKAGRKGGSKVLHNSKSVMIKSKGKTKNTPPKLRAKDFKWSHYIKTMRFWCKDCGHGFKNQKDSLSHSEEQCKFNCLYLLECYVSVKDIVQHKTYGEKVEELLEEYQVDADHKCNKCGTTVSRKADFLVHVDTHKDFMPWECTICGTRFKIRGSLKEHLRYTHMKGRVPCLKCNKVFATSTQLRQHVKVHTQHYKYTRVGKNREEDLRVAREAEEHEEAPAPPVEAEEQISSDQLSHEANEYRNWCKLMELNAMKNIATNDSGRNEEDLEEEEEEDEDIMESDGEES